VGITEVPTLQRALTHLRSGANKGSGQLLAASVAIEPTRPTFRLTLIET